jgi:hypothetical protein
MDGGGFLKCEGAVLPTRDFPGLSHSRPLNDGSDSDLIGRAKPDLLDPATAFGRPSIPPMAIFGYPPLGRKDVIGR